MTGNELYDELPEIDRQIIEAVIDAALALPATVSVYDGEAWALTRSSDRAAILAALCSTDGDQLRFRDLDGTPLGGALLVYGNEPGAVLCDHTENEHAEALFGRANALADAYID